MESSSPTVPFPLLQTPIESKYRVCTIPYRFPSDNPRKATPVEIQWIDLFLNSVSSFRFAFLAFPFDPWLREQVKHPEVAQFLGGRLYDCVFKYHEVLNY
ncbi:hypothetical protein B296_00043535 [Ensete ventricosum]|uniref:Uncharacterized protein n=1 Tax=Ensete ventricosum TaxID=4639 RepID=A0A426Z0Y6_ENSVE|nr:hypothetical protein B296_00043535 [Ensete ventricosum]